MRHDVRGNEKLIHKIISNQHKKPTFIIKFQHLLKIEMF